MKLSNNSIYLFILIFFISLTSCEKEIGSPQWCEQMKDKPKIDWTAEELKTFATRCVGA